MIWLAVSLPSACAQSFTDTGLAFTGAIQGAHVWGDFDNDGDLDLLLYEQPDLPAQMMTLYRNEGNGTFTPLTTAIPGATRSAITLGDYDRDGWLDVALIGENSRRGLLFRNRRDMTFEEVSAPLGPIETGNLTWGDFDNDGDLDLLVSGYHTTSNGYGPFTRLFRNDGAAGFQMLGFDFLNVGGGTVEFGDYDGDGDLDILLNGVWQNGLMRAALFRNDNGQFAGRFLEPAPTIASSPQSERAQFIDFDNDGDLDIALTGFLAAPHFLRNDGQETFTRIDTSLPQRDLPGAAAWGDVDNDGDLDLLLLGPELFSKEGDLFYNNGAAGFLPAGLRLSAPAFPSVSWADFDRDGDLDLFVNGRDCLATGCQGPRLFRNTATVTNHPPAPPSGLNATVLLDNRVLLAWSPATDRETPSGGLSYELRVGTQPGRADILVPPADLGTGQRRVVAPGAIKSTQWIVGPLTRGTYSWSVQAVDTGFAGSAFASAASVQITNAAPVISPIPDQFTGVGIAVTVALSISDQETPAAALVVEFQSSNETLLPRSAIALTGNGSARTLRLSPTAGLTGETTVTLTVTDASGTFTKTAFRFRAEPFSEFDLGVEQSPYAVFYGSLADIDNDGDLDLLVGLGSVEGSRAAPQALLGRNDGRGEFTWEPFVSGGPILQSGSWVDFDRDGDLDFLTNEGTSIYCYRNDAGHFTRLPTPVLQNVSGPAQWGDFNHDGALDAFVTILNAGVVVHRNRGDGTFESGQSLVSGGVYLYTWLDADADGNSDIFAGQRLFRQAGEGIFSDTGIEFGPTLTLAAFDLNADGAVDILGAGAALSAFVNDGQGHFARRDAGSFIHTGFIGWGDFNLDGSNDLFSSGMYSFLGNPALAARIYWNDSTGNFGASNTELSVHALGTVLVGDLDNDGDLDAIALGMPNFEAARLIRNNLGLANLPPAAPTGLTAVAQHDDRVTLNWARATDDHTPASALTYELRVGTAPGKADVIAPPADVFTGRRRLPQPGDLGAVTHVDLRHLPAGTYYWSVQSVDAALLGSAWATPQTFTLAKPALSPIADVLTPPGAASRPIAFTVSSSTTPAEQIQMSASADDPSLVAPTGFAFGGTGSNRTLVITPANQRGETFVNITATDAAGFTSSVRFRLDVAWFAGVPLAPPLLTAPGSDLAWVDLDADGRLDLICFGANEAFPTNAFSAYLNGGEAKLQPVSVDLPWWFSGTILAGDLDGDNHPDFLLAGADRRDPSSPRPEYRVWHDDGGLRFSALTPQLIDAAVALRFTDLDFDSVSDLAGWGQRNSFRLPLDALVDPARGFPALSPGASLSLAGVVWADFDGDGDFDLAFSGQANGVNFIRVFRRDPGGQLTEMDTGLPGNVQARLDAADVDNDGLPDLFVGRTWIDLVNPPGVWRNLGNFQFAPLSTAFEPHLNGVPAWADFDNDGDLDALAISSLDGSVAGNPGSHATLYLNDGQGHFTGFDARLPDLMAQSAAWGDVDGDGDLDVALTGYTGWNQVGRFVALNASLRSNTPPTAPTGLSVTFVGEEVLLAWTPASDTESPKNLTYNVRVGTALGGSQIVSAIADPLTGKRRLGGPGNSGPAPRRRLGKLPNGTYYWSVQTVDAGYASSLFASEQSFRISRPALGGLTNLTVAPNTLAGPFNFTVSDAETPASALKLTVTSANQELIPDGNIFIGGSGASRTLNFIPAPHKSGRAVLTISAEDGNGEMDLVRITVTVSEEFSLLAAGLPMLREGVAAWADADGDGDLDLLTGGFTSMPFNEGDGRCDLWRNDAGVITTNRLATFNDAGAGAAAFADADNDGNLDLVVSGGRGLAVFYRQTAPGEFAPRMPGPLTLLTRSALAWGDLDSDGRPDLAAIGSTDFLSSGNRAILFRNQLPASFFGLQLGSSGLRDGAAIWFDMDGDGDDDLLLTGSTDSGPDPWRTLLFRNDDGVLGSIPTTLPALTRSSAAVADYDLDGLPDILVCGQRIATNQLQTITQLFHNEGNGAFSLVETPFPGFHSGNAAWGDYDGDGDPDLLLSGVADGGFRTELWVNEPARFFRSGNSFGGQAARGVAWGDMDGDGDLDLVLAGLPPDFTSPPSTPPFTGLFRNDLHQGGSSPSVPIELTAESDGTDVILAWRMPDGAPRGMSFNVRAGFSPGAIDILSPLADPATGRRRVAAPGNASWSFQRRLRNLAGQTIYWSVQAIDPAFRASAFAPEQTSQVSRNERPTISDVPFQTGAMNATLGPIGFGVSDLDDDVSTLEVSVTSSNRALIPDNAIQLSGNGGFREITLTPLTNAHGVTMITITARDPHGSTAVKTFRVVILAVTEIAAGLPQFLPAALEPADYDHDGDVDLFLAGWEPTDVGTGIRFHDLFAGDGSSLTRLGDSILPGGDVRGAWGDFDGDGDLDLFAASAVYRNDRSQFTLFGGLGSDPTAAGAWGDFDGDGDLDLAVVGGGTKSAKIWRNAGGQFTDAGALLQGVFDGAVAWGDADNDGDLDLAISGRELDSLQSFPQLRIYRNEGGVFTEARHFFGASKGTLQWADVNRDGRPDLLVAGSTFDGSRERLFFNLGNFDFVETNPRTSSSGVSAFPGAQLFDFDNDGDLDLAEHTASATFGVKLNDGTGQFAVASAAFANVPAGLLRFTDFDGDGDFDLLVGGRTTGGTAYDGSVKLFRNHWRSSAPSVNQLTASVNGNDVELHWPVRNDFGPGTPVTFDLRVGKKPGGIDVVSPLSQPFSGRRMVAASGNMGFAHTTQLRGLAPGTYYWSVQPVDSAWVGGPFAPEASFTIGSTPATTRIEKIEFANLFALQLTVLASSGSLAVVEVSTDLKTWTAQASRRVGSTGAEVISVDRLDGLAFYRVGIIP